jgi:hypothetical protein
MHEIKQLACLAAVFVAIVGVPLWFLFRLDTCPKCKRRMALWMTGAKRGGNWLRGGGEVEMKCKYCGERQWRGEGGGGD